jgi:hypothetical protein
MTPFTRRQLIRTGMAGSVTAALAAWVGPGAVAEDLLPTGPSDAHQRRTPAPSPRASTPRIPLHAVVLDERFAEAARFGASARLHGMATRAVHGDVTDFWYGELYPLWKQRAVPIAGLTAYAALFCLEQLAWDHRMRVIYRGAHTRRADGRVDHVLAGPRPVVGSIGPGIACDWPTELASSIGTVESHGGWTGLAPASRGSEERCRTHDATHVGRLRGRRGGPQAHAALAHDHGSTLYSWVIALPARA